LFVLAHGVCHEKEQEASSIASNQAEGLPALFAIHDAIIDHNVQGVEENLAGFLETDTVLALVGEVLHLIPVEPDSRHYNSVITFVQIYKPATGEEGPLIPPSPECATKTATA